MMRLVFLFHLLSHQVVVQIVIFPIAFGLVTDRTSGFRHLTERLPSGIVIIQQTESTLILL